MTLLRGDSRPFANPEDGELILEVVSNVGDTVQVWQTTFPDPNPVRLRIVDCDDNDVEAWINDRDSRALSRALDVIK